MPQIKTVHYNCGFGFFVCLFLFLRMVLLVLKGKLLGNVDYKSWQCPYKSREEKKKPLPWELSWHGTSHMVGSPCTRNSTWGLANIWWETLMKRKNSELRKIRQTLQNLMVWRDPFMFVFKLLTLEFTSEFSEVLIINTLCHHKME